MFKSEDQSDHLRYSDIHEMGLSQMTGDCSNSLTLWLVHTVIKAGLASLFGVGVVLLVHALDARERESLESSKLWEGLG